MTSFSLKMNVHKFGHHTSSSLRRKHSSEESDLQIENGTFNVKNRRIIEVEEPEISSDVATKHYVDDCLQHLRHELISQHDNIEESNAMKKLNSKLVEIKAEVDKCLRVSENGTIDFKLSRLVNSGDALQGKDVANKQTVEYLMQTKSAVDVDVLRSVMRQYISQTSDDSVSVNEETLAWNELITFKILFDIVTKWRSQVINKNL